MLPFLDQTFGFRLLLATHPEEVDLPAPFVPDEGDLLPAKPPSSVEEEDAPPCAADLFETIPRQRA